MKVLDLFSGIGGGSLGFEMAGFDIIGHSEIDHFPAAVLKHHWPEVQNHGDITRFEEWPGMRPDVIVGGSPCQSFSVAGLRRGLADPRGQLMLAYLAVIRRYRPSWVVWENVPGALSVDGGRAFATLLRGLEECGYHAAWRVLDASRVRIDGFCRAVPQRRRRVFLVGHLGDWRRAAAVLFDTAGCEWRSAPRCRQGCETSASAATGLGTGGAYGDERMIANCLTRRMHKGMNSTIDEGQTPIVVNARQEPVTADKHGALDTDGSTHAIVNDDLRVRRLTPIECERLQGFPDGWTNITFRCRPASDSARYKALGNAMAVNCVRWIAERIMMVEVVRDTL